MRIDFSKYRKFKQEDVDDFLSTYNSTGIAVPEALRLGCCKDYEVEGYHWITSVEDADPEFWNTVADFVMSRLIGTLFLNVVPNPLSPGNLKGEEYLDPRSFGFRKTSVTNRETGTKNVSKNRASTHSEIYEESGSHDIDGTKTYENSSNKKNTGTVTDSNVFDGTNKTTPNIRTESVGKQQISPIGEYLGGDASTLNYPTESDKSVSISSGDSTVEQDSTENKTRTDDLTEVVTGETSEVEDVSDSITKEGNRTSSATDIDEGDESTSNDFSSDVTYEMYDLKTGDKIDIIRNIDPAYFAEIIRKAVQPFILEFRMVY